MVEKNGGTQMISHTCPVCRSQETFNFLKRTGIPVVQNMIFSDKKSAISVPRGDIHLSCCKSCGFIFNSAFDEKLIMYGNAYDNRQQFSEYFHLYMKKISECLIQKKGVTNSRIIEVGCGDGTFLRLLLSDERNGNTGTGFDPSYRGPESDCNGRARFIIDYYDQRYADFRADVVVSRHVIEHIADPIKFLSCIRDSLGKQNDATVFLETPDVNWILKNNSFWDFCYEHCSYFSPESLSHALRFAGFRPVEIIRTFSGQYMLSIAKPVEYNPDKESRAQYKNEISDIADEYAQNEQNFIEKNRSALKKLKETGNVFLWGAGAKGVMYANTIDPDYQFISGIVDVNPDKQDGFIPGTGHQVISPDRLPQSGAVIIMNENYTEEIKKQVSSHGKQLRLYSVHRLGE
jgi:2-polyprenyl-3-methyl-5-hydroxy-6-metoxy-1,4-benzoquinol methylase